VRIDYSPRMFGLRTNMIAMLVILVGAGAYLALAGQRRRRRLRARRPSVVQAPPRPLRPRSSRAAAGTLGVTGPLEVASTVGPDGEAADDAAGPVTGSPLQS
jgi:hypothetical protein